MFRTMLRLQWRWLRVPLGLLAATALVLPLLAAGSGSQPVGAEAVLGSASLVGALLGALAVVTGLVVAHVLWTQDGVAGRVYALTLPIKRERYWINRLAGSAVLMLVPAAGILGGVLGFAGRHPLPPGVQAYALTTAGRAWLVMLLACTLLLALRMALSARARRVIAVACLALLAGMYVESATRPMGTGVLTQGAGRVLTGSLSPLAVVFRPWRIVDL